ncbi:TPA: hypothetical protein MEW43_005074 [Klebsiella pneumoniae]|nr:hypothetical protein [Klebsiella pneumoniae]HBW2991960.1 hypothetical protein [Klebsiella pneumoniae]HCI9922107.1 hypothetical protein [Klebsiella pneumoniae]HDY7388293.1 hypothetical protein [Klebsiella pneumoniae]HDZ2622298.1 hypothetical protein [Klebsiella pneumoniae]
MTKKIESEVIKRLQALNPETVRLDEMNRVVTLIGWTLSEKLPDTYSDENKGKDIEHDSDSLGISRVTRNGCCNPTEAVVLEHFLVGVVNPLTNAPKKTPRETSAVGPGGYAERTPVPFSRKTNAPATIKTLYQ